MLCDVSNLIRICLWLSLAGVVLLGCECNSVGVCTTEACKRIDAGVRGCDPSRADNALRDTDCDGLSDAEEFHIDYGGGSRTDACDEDSDNDGLGDGVEMGRTSSVDGACVFRGDADPSTKTNPVLQDSDGDGLRDGEEDLNLDGKLDPGESNPARADSDCDGLSDAEEVKGARGCISNPLALDTDGDGIFDGVEAGLESSAVDTQCTYDASLFDAHPASRTNACSADSDGDGIIDGAEDTNHNGRVDPGELSPLDAADGAGPAGQACANDNLRPVHFESVERIGLKLALVPSFTEISTLRNPAGEALGLVFYDPTRKVVGLAFGRPPVGASASDEETDIRQRLGGISGAIAQTFTTWDGHPQSVRATYDQAVTRDLKAHVNELAKLFLGPSITGLLDGASNTQGPFKVQAELVVRGPSNALVVLALTPQMGFTHEQLFELDDVAGGSALATFSAATGTQCEVFTSSAKPAIDFLWVVDNSCSMAGYQNAVGLAGNVLGEKLGAAGLDWRVGGVTTAFYADNSISQYRAFTGQVPVMQQWFTSNTPSWFGIAGTGAEQSLSSAQKYIQSMLLPRTTDVAQNKVRAGSDLHVLLLTDADDQSAFSIASLNAVFADYDAQGSSATVHGLVCPQGLTCGESQSSPRRNLGTIRATGGVLGDINVAQSGSAQLTATLDAMMTAVVARTGHLLLRPPIGTTIKVAIERNATVGVCNVNDVPRDRSNGFDFDAATRRLVFYGACRPSAAGVKVAVSYRFWRPAP